MTKRMPPIILCLILLTGSLGLSGCTRSAPGPELNDEQVKAEVRGAFDAYVADLNRGDYAQAALIYERGQNFHWIERGGIQYASGAEAAASLQSFEGQGVTPRMTNDEMHVAYLSPGSALVSTHFTFEMMEAGGETRFAFNGWMSVAMVKRQNRWLFAAGQVGPGREAP